MRLFRKPKSIPSPPVMPPAPEPGPEIREAPLPRSEASGPAAAPPPRSGSSRSRSRGRRRTQPPDPLTTGGRGGRQGQSPRGQSQPARSQGQPPRGQASRPAAHPPAPAPQAKPIPGPKPPRAPQVPRTTPFEEQIRYFFRDKALREQALTHSSFAYENQGRGRDNELLEFLGDSVIGLITADYFYTTYRDTTEGELSKLKSSASSTVALAEFAKQIHLDKHIQLGRGEERSGGRHKANILADVFEAVVGAVYLDGGLEAARYFFLPLVESTFEKVHASGYTVDNYKSALQEYLQKEDLPSPSYKVVSCTGPDHDRVFTVEVFANRTSLAKAKGASRKAAEQKAAEAALKSFMGKRIKSLTPETFIVEK